MEARVLVRRLPAYRSSFYRIGAWASIAAVTLAVATPARAADPTKDQCITDNENGQRLQKEGKLREAKDQLLVCIANSCPKVVRDDCADRLRAVDAAQPTIAFDAKDASGTALTAVTVTLDGAPLTDHLDGSALPIDPGEHKLTFQAAGMAPLDQTIVAKAGEKNRHEAIVLAPAAPVPPPPPPPPVPPPPTPEAGHAPAPIPAYAALGVGGAGLVAGVIFTVLYASAKHDGDAACIPSCDPQTADSWESKQKTDSIGMGIGYGVAVVGGGIGTWLLLSQTAGKTAPAAPAAVGVSPQLGLGWAGVEGRFE